MKAFKGGLFGCFGVGAAILIAIIVVVVIASGGNKGASTSSSPAATGAPRTAATLLDLTGSGSKTTQKFQAPGDWTIDYTYDCTAFGQSGNFAVMVAGDAIAVPVNELGTKKTGSSAVHSGGKVYLEITSECDWHVTAKG